MPDATSAALPQPARRPYSERTLLLTLAAVQFTHIVDFMVMMPLGPKFLDAFGITPQQFGELVSGYSFSAGFFGFLAAFFIDRFDRKKALLTLYGGFAIGTFSCALATGYWTLLAARVITGAFGGVAASVVTAIVGDVIPLERRGRAMGLVMSSFSIAQIAGVPLGLTLADHFNWHAPFVFLALCAVCIGAYGWMTMPRLRGHAAAGAAQARWLQVKEILSLRNHQHAFALNLAITFAGSLIFPYLATSLVLNAGLSDAQLPLVYLLGGGVTLVTLGYVGRLSDRYGKLRVFCWLVPLSCLATAIVTNLPSVSLWVALAATTYFVVVTSGRFVPGQAMIASAVVARMRGGFSSVSAAIQQLAGGSAALIGGMLLEQDASKHLTGFPWVGVLSIAAALASILFANRLKLIDDTTAPFPFTSKGSDADMPPTVSELPGGGEAL